MRAGDRVKLVECMPSMHDVPALHEPWDMEHAYKLAVGRWRQEDQRFMATLTTK